MRNNNFEKRIFSFLKNDGAQFKFFFFFFNNFLLYTKGKEKKGWLNKLKAQNYDFL